MSALRKILLVLLITFIVGLPIAISMTIGWRPFIGPRVRATTDRHFESNPARVERGRYLVQNVMGCETCHTARDFTKHGAPKLGGGDLAGQPLPLPGFPGSAVAPNVTPDKETGAGSWTDDQIARAIREGIKHDGTTLFPLMPYMNYKVLSDEDIASVVVFLRSTTPIHLAQQPTTVKFPVNYLVRGVPEPVTAPLTGPNASDTLARGKYIYTLGCGCHSAIETSPGAGGEQLAGPWGDVTSANITSDPSGISYYDEAKFIAAVRTGYVGARALSPIMPYDEFAGMTDDDVKALYAYVKSLPAVKHRVDNTLPATYCKVCKHKHGAGDQN